MADQTWGHCQHCKYFASLARIPLPTEEARCRQPELARFNLRVFGASGCSAFELREGLEKEVERPPVHINV